MKPTKENPLLIGLLVDVSGSMMASIYNEHGKSSTRIESFRDSLEELVEKAKKLSQEGERIAPLIKLFVFGFGFGNLLSNLFGSKGPSVRDLLKIPGEPTSTLTIDKLASEWKTYKSHVEGLATQMFGSTPMGEAFQIVADRFKLEMADGNYSNQPVLYILSDGAPTDVSSEMIVNLSNQIKDSGILIVSCFVTDTNVTEPRRLYGEALESWDPATKLMFDCASIIPKDSSFNSYLIENRWKVDQKGRLFTQINQSEILSEFMQSILSPLEEYDNSLVSTQSDDKPTLLDNIEKHFNLEELKKLCFDFGLPPDKFPQTLDGFARELILYFDRRGELAQLKSYCKQKRPKAFW